MRWRACAAIGAALVCAVVVLRFNGFAASGAETPAVGAADRAARAAAAAAALRGSLLIDGAALAECGARIAGAGRRRKFRATHHLWRGTLAARDAEHGRFHDLVSAVPRSGVVFLYVPKVASSTSREYAAALGGTATTWPAALAESPAATTFALTRDPLERFLSALGTLAHRSRGDGWSANAAAGRCGNATAKAFAGTAVGRYSYPHAAELARCVLERAEAAGPYFNHHLAPQVSYYVVPAAAAGDGGNVSAAPFAGVRSPAPVRAFPMLRAEGTSNVQAAWDAAADNRGPRSPPLPASARNVQEGRFKPLNYTRLLAKLGPHFARRTCRLYEDDYACLRLPAPDACRPVLGDDHPGGFFRDPTT